MENLEQKTTINNSPKMMKVITVVSAVVAVSCLFIVLTWSRDLVSLKAEVQTLFVKVGKVEEALGLQELMREIAVPNYPRVSGTIVSIVDNTINLEIKSVTFVDNKDLKKGDSPFLENTKSLQIVIDKETKFNPKREDLKKGEKVTILLKEELVPDATSAVAKLVTVFVPPVVDKNGNTIEPASQVSVEPAVN